jgi:hypothetical protein
MPGGRGALDGGIVAQICAKSRDGNEWSKTAENKHAIFINNHYLIFQGIILTGIDNLF